MCVLFCIDGPWLLIISIALHIPDGSLLDRALLDLNNIFIQAWTLARPASSHQGSLTALLFVIWSSGEWLSSVEQNFPWIMKILGHSYVNVDMNNFLFPLSGLEFIGDSH